MLAVILKYLKRYIFVLLVLVIVFGILGIGIYSTLPQPAEADGNFNGLTLDVARIHYSVPTLEKFISLVHSTGGKFVQLHLSDTNDFAVESQIIGQTKKNGTKKGSVWENKKTKQTFYSNYQIKELVDFAEKQKITLIPEVDTPAHIGGIVATMEENGKKSEIKNLVRTDHKLGLVFHLTATSANFVNKLNNEIAQNFAGQNNARFHLGGDEFSTSYKENSAYINYLNKTSNYIENLGFIPEAWNDGFTKAGLSKFNKDIQITYWNWIDDKNGTALGKKYEQSRATMPYLINHGFKVFNYNDYYLYFIVNKFSMQKDNIDYMSSDMKKNWNPKIWHDDNPSSLKSTKGIIGSSASIWGQPGENISQKSIYDSPITFFKTFMKICNKYES